MSILLAGDSFLNGISAAGLKMMGTFIRPFLLLVNGECGLWPIFFSQCISLGCSLCVMQDSLGRKPCFA